MADTLTLADQFSLYQYRPRQRPRKGNGSNSPAPSLKDCDHLSFSVAIDVVILVLVLGACGFLFTPYVKFVAAEAAEVVPAALFLIGEVVIQAPVAYAGATVFMFVAVLASYEIWLYLNRKCDNPNCRGLRNAVALDIQLETEECVKLSGAKELAPWNGEGGIGLKHEQKELEAELRKMAPPNGRTVLIFRAPCGCPAARFEVSGCKKTRKSKK